MKKLRLITKTLLVAAFLGVGMSAWAVVNTDSQGRKQYVWNLGCEAKASVGGTDFTDYFLKASESAYGDYSAVYGTSGNYDIAKAHIYGGRCIYANISADSDKGGGASMAKDQGYLEFYAPISGIVTLVGCYSDRPKIYDVTTSTNSGSDKYLSVSAGDKIQIYSNLNNNSGHGVEKIVLTQTFYEETITNPSITGERNALTITAGVSSWTAGGVAREANAGASSYRYATSIEFNPTVTTYYTLDGTIPTLSSTVYNSGTIDASSAPIMNCITSSETGLTSEVASVVYGLVSVSTATIWDYAALKAAQTNGGFATDGTVWVKNMNDDSSNSRLKFQTTLGTDPTELGNDMVAFKAGVSGQVYMRLVDYSATVSVYDGTTKTDFVGGTSGGGTGQSNVNYHGGNSYYKYATFQVEAGKQYYIYRTAASGSSPNAGVYFIEFQPTGNNTTTALTEATTWSFVTQNDILTEYHGITKDNMYFGEGLTDVHTASVGYRITFNGTGNTATGANILSFKLPADVKGYISLMPSCYHHKLTLKAGETTLKEFSTGSSGDHNKDISVWVTTDAETTIYLYSPDADLSSNQPGTRYITWTPDVSGTIGSNGYTTFSSPYPLALGSMTASTGDVTAYYATAVGGSSVTLTSIAENVEAGEGLILKGTAGATFTIPVAVSGSAISNYLVGCPTATELTTPNDNYYVMVNSGENVEFQALNGSYTDNKVTIPAGKAYLNVSAANARLSVVFNDDETTTGIDDVRSKMSDVRSEYYNLNGQRIEKPSKGLYIVNGKKVILK